MEGLMRKMIASWADEDGSVNSMPDLLAWIRRLNETTRVNIRECSIHDGTMWFYDDYNGEVLNRKRSFFSIQGMRYFVNDEFVSEQPIIIQPEIGYLGIICREINGTLNFLMQAKVEPGNVNCVQISPTVQATKSNFTRAHGGRLPFYFEYFEHSGRYQVLYDQIQSEQAARFYKKRNRNIVILVDEDVEVYPNFKWMTLGQIKKLMEIDNLVSMDARTVIAGIPLASDRSQMHAGDGMKHVFRDEGLYHSMFLGRPLERLPRLYHKMNHYKMFQDVRVTPVPLNQLVDWKVDEYGITCKKQADFMVRYYDIEISGREVGHWMQPLLKAIGRATLGLVTKKKDGMRKFLVKFKPEIGSFDRIEIGPTIQWEPTHCLCDDDAVEKVFRAAVERRQGILNDVILSEEGGRFYHEQNHNVILEIGGDELEELPQEYAWTDFCTLNYLVQANNCLNIQLRNLLALLKL